MQVQRTCRRKWDEMVPEREIDSLIEAGWYVLESDFNEAAFLHWRAMAHECLVSLLGPDHTYTEHFENNMRQPEATILLSGVGILVAAGLGGHHHRGEKDKESEVASEANISRTSSLYPVPMRDRRWKGESCKS